MSSDNRIKDIILITERLIDVLKRENSALKEHRAKDLHELLDDKVTMSRVYETRMQYFNKNPDELTNSSADLQDKLRDLAAQINSLLQDNTKMLQVAIEANRRVVDMIAEAVKSSNPGAGTYGSNGITGLSKNKSQAQGLALSLDQTL